MGPRPFLVLPPPHRGGRVRSGNTTRSRKISLFSGSILMDQVPRLILSIAVYGVRSSSLSHPCMDRLELNPPIIFLEVVGITGNASRYESIVSLFYDRFGCGDALLIWQESRRPSPASRPLPSSLCDNRQARSKVCHSSKVGCAGAIMDFSRRRIYPPYACRFFKFAHDCNTKHTGASHR